MTDIIDEYINDLLDDTVVIGRDQRPTMFSSSFPSSQTVTIVSIEEIVDNIPIAKNEPVVSHLRGAFASHPQGADTSRFEIVEEEPNITIHSSNEPDVSSFSDPREIKSSKFQLPAASSVPQMIPADHPTNKLADTTIDKLPIDKPLDKSPPDDQPADILTTLKNANNFLSIATVDEQNIAIHRYLSMLNHFIYYQLKAKTEMKIRMFISTITMLTHLEVRFGDISETFMGEFTQNLGQIGMAYEPALEFSHQMLFAKLIPCLIRKSSSNIDKCVIAATKKLPENSPQTYAVFFVFNILHHLIRNNISVVPMNSSNNADFNSLINNVMINSKKHTQMRPEIKTIISYVWNRPDPLKTVHTIMPGGDAAHPSYKIIAASTWLVRLLKIANETNGRPNLERVLSIFAAYPQFEGFEYLVYLIIGSSHIGKAQLGAFVEQKIIQLMSKLGDFEF